MESSSGTFLNGHRLSPQALESPKIELHDGDVIKLGEDCEVNGGKNSVQATVHKVNSVRYFYHYSFPSKRHDENIVACERVKLRFCISFEISIV
ncbi:hypothetical protein HDU76_002821 [Blyttiomyces sp. JEL0837]|nr:hypothetical protein HDU76_002821 [Blyttiomyces sp. JEL0837]